jgi:gliding motility-associated-like protein
MVEDNNKCRDTLAKNIIYFPVPPLIVIDPNTFVGCKPANIFFKNLSKPIDATYTLEWDFGDGKKANEISPTNLYEEIGEYTVKLNITSPIGCVTSKTWTNLIRVVDSPKAGFSFTPEEPNLNINTVNFIDESKDAFAYLWLFDSLDISLSPNPSFTFRDTGLFDIKQIVIHESGCSDTASTLIYIRPIVSLFMPNAFTPNQDGLNDIFIPKGRFVGLTNYSFAVWNRWGDRIFYTEDINSGWNGRRDNTGQNAPPGVYVYTIEYIDTFNKPQSLKGNCTLLP